MDYIHTYLLGGISTRKNQDTDRHVECYAFINNSKVIKRKSLGN